MAYLSVDVDIETKRNGINIEDLKKYFQNTHLYSKGLVSRILWTDHITQ